MLRVAWWLVVALACVTAVQLVVAILGVPYTPIVGGLTFYVPDLVVVALFARAYTGSSWAQLVPIRGMALWLLVPVALITLGGLVLTHQLVDMCLALNVLPPEVFDLLSGGSGDSPGQSLSSALITDAVYPAVFEELVNRGLVLTALASTMSNRRAIVISALFFSIQHFAIERTPHTFMLGLVYGWMFVRTRSLLPGMVAHFLHNATIELLSRAGTDTDSYALSGWVMWTGVVGIVAGMLVIRYTWPKPVSSMHEDEQFQEDPQRLAA